MSKILTDTNTIRYKAMRYRQKNGKHNGAYYYSKEIVKNIAPYVKTYRPWDTLGMRRVGTTDSAIVFLHHCIHWEKVYYWLRAYNDLVLVCSTAPTLEWAKTIEGAHPILLPLSIDVKSVERYRCDKTKRACYAGNRWAFKRADEEANIPDYVDYPPASLPREELLQFIAPYKELYAIGRCALEGLALGCEIKPFYRKYLDPSYWVLLDNRKAAVLLQKALDDINRGARFVDCRRYPEYIEQALSNGGHST